MAKTRRGDLRFKEYEYNCCDNRSGEVKKAYEWSPNMCKKKVSWRNRGERRETRDERDER